RRHTRFSRDWSSDVCSSDLVTRIPVASPHDSGVANPPSFAVLGDTHPGDVRGGVRSREPSAQRSLMPVDYTKAPPMYSHMEPARSEERRVGSDYRSPRSATN